MKQVITLLLITGILASCGTNQSQTTSGENSPNRTPMNKKEIVATFLGAVAKQDTTTMREWANADYIQHNPFVPTGLEPFIQLLPVLKETIS